MSYLLLQLYFYLKKRNELNTVQQAFGSNLANELIKTYEGSNLVSDSQQDLVGDKYLAEQIRMIQEQQKTTSILDKWGHLLYEGERDYKSSVGTGGAGTGSKTSLNAQSTGGTVSGGGYMNTYSNGSIAHYNQLIEQHQQQQQQLQQEQEQQQEIIQQFHEQLQQVTTIILVASFLVFLSFFLKSFIYPLSPHFKL